MFKHKLKGQSTLEYVILLGFVVAALLAMGIYMKRGVQGRIRESTDQIGEQYSAKNTTGNFLVNSKSDTKEKMLGKGATETTWVKGANWQTKSGKETIDILDNETKDE
jgi:hypothetical protein